MAKKKKKFVNRHRIPLKERMVYTSKVENEMLDQMRRSIFEAFPDKKQRAFYISNLIKGLEDEIQLNKNLDNIEKAKGN